MTPKQKLIGALVLMCLNVAISGPEGKTMTEPAVIEAVENKPLEFVPLKIDDIFFADHEYPGQPDMSRLQIKEKGKDNPLFTPHHGIAGEYSIEIKIAIDPQLFQPDISDRRPAREVMQGTIELWDTSGVLLKEITINSEKVIVYYTQYNHLVVYEELSPLEHGDYVLKFKLKLNKQYVNKHLSIKAKLRHPLVDNSHDFNWFK